MPGEPLAQGFVVADKYEIERELGRGGMGVVFVVRHVTTGKRMAMKCLLPQFVYDAELVGRFLREAKAMGRLQHRHVVDIFDVGRDGDVLYMVMELLEGMPLSELLRDEATTLEDALVILVRAMEGVAAAHQQGVVHRDLKPDNIFVCWGASGRLDDPRVLDFGISRIDDGGGRLTRTGVAMGTPYYMAFEQLSGQRDLDHRVDVYAMGVILYEAIAGAPPFPGESFSAIAVRMLTTQPEALTALRPDLPRGLAAVVMRAMERQRDARFGSMRELVTALGPYLPAYAVASEARGLPLRAPRASAPGGGSVDSEIRVRVQASPLAPDGAADLPKRTGGVRRIAAGAALLAVVGTTAAWVSREDEPVAEQPALPVVQRDAVEAAPAAPVAVAPAPSQGDAIASDAGAHATPTQAPGPATSPVARASAPVDASVAAPRWAPGRAVATPGAGRPPLGTRVNPQLTRVGGLAASPSDAGVASASANRALATPTASEPPAQPVPPVLTPKAAPEPPASTAQHTEGRAGKLGSSEF